MKDIKMVLEFEKQIETSLRINILHINSELCNILRKDKSFWACFQKDYDYNIDCTDSYCAIRDKLNSMDVLNKRKLNL